MAENRMRFTEDFTSRILEVRYTDLEKEKRLCLELLVLAKEECDLYGEVFALAYLGDYYIAVSDMDRAGKYLLKAQRMFPEDQDWEELRLGLTSLLGIYYDMRGDEQNAIDYYLKAVTIAEALGDADRECVVLNNLAFAFQRHRCYEVALEFYQKAYWLQKNAGINPVRSILLENLAEVSLFLRQYEEAKEYILEFEENEKDPLQRVVMGDKNWCCYYGAVGEREKALVYADRLLRNQDVINENKMTAFESYHMLCRSMLELREADYAGRFLKAMEEVSVGGGLDQVQTLEEMRIQYSLLFEPPEKHSEAYCFFYKKNQQFRAKIDETIAGAMKTRIQLEQLMQQVEDMQSEQKILEREVNRDELTGAYNRRFLETLIREHTDGEAEESFAFIVMDVDFFKEYNDFYGHLKGDEALREIAACMMEGARERIYASRYGGDEFVCVCIGLTEKEIRTYIEEVRKRLHARAIPHEKSLCSGEVTLSTGYAIGIVKTQIEVRQLLQLADHELYQSKNSGRNTFTGKRVDIS